MTTTTHSTQRRTPEGRGGALIGELALPIVLVALGIFTAIGIVTMNVIGDEVPGPQFFPTVVAVLLVSTGVAMGVLAVRQHRRVAAGGGEEPARSDMRTLVVVVAAFVVFLVILPVIGWLLSAGALFYAISWALGSRDYVRYALIAVTFSAIVQIAFSMGLGLALPTGVIGVVSSWIS